jgi:hypothetical protein
VEWLVVAFITYQVAHLILMAEYYPWLIGFGCFLPKLIPTYSISEDFVSYSYSYPFNQEFPTGYDGSSLTSLVVVAIYLD